MNSLRVKRLVSLLSRLPGVGEKTAQRYAMFLLSTDAKLTHDLGAALSELMAHVRTCERCGNLAEVEDPSQLSTECAVCTDDKRDRQLLCVVGKVHDLLAIERTGAMRGRYFVLGKLLSPLDGVGPEALPLARLLERVAQDQVREVLVATPPSVDGEATALLLRRELEPCGVAVTRIASGVPHGGDLEYADPITMGRAIQGRQRI